MTSRKIHLLPTQIDHAERCKKILLKSYCYIDTSVMGSGKTFVVGHIAQHFNFSVLVVCPFTTSIVWKKLAEEYDVDIIDIITYQSLRSISDHQPKHGYLRRIDGKKGKKSVSFAPTEKYTELVRRGIFVVFDEFQNIKNNSSQYKACLGLTNTIVTSGGKTRFALLSASPFDKEEHAVHISRIIGFIRYSKLVMTVKDSKEVIYLGLGEMLEACRLLDKDRTDSIFLSYQKEKYDIKHLIFVLFRDIVMRGISSSMPTEAIVMKKDIKNGFYNMDKEDEIELVKNVEGLGKAVKFDVDKGLAQIDSSNITYITTFLVNIEYAKKGIFYRLTKTDLDEIKGCKVILFLNYNNTLMWLKEALKDYKPLILNGETRKKDRTEIIKKFQEPNLDYRLIISNIAVGGVGISLHDTNGSFPRRCYISSSYSLINQAQASGRAYRTGVKSDVFIRTVYGKGAMLETEILTAIAKKTNIMKSILSSETTEKLILPGEYEKFIE